MPMTRRLLMASLAAAPLGSRSARAAPAREIGWEELIPEGVPYSEIVGEGEYDENNDTWLPVFDANAHKFVEALDGARIKMPGYVLPIDVGAEGVTSFILTPYVGACIHVPPLPANQLVFVTVRRPWPSETMWDAIWVTGTIRVNPISTTLADIGYEMDADEIELYEW